MARPKHSYIGVDNTELTKIATLVREMDARTHALFAKVHNIQVELDRLTEAHSKWAALLKDLLAKPESAEDAQNIVREYIFDILKKQKR